jgi:hypothetical protein
MYIATDRSPLSLLESTGPSQRARDESSDSESRASRQTAHVTLRSWLLPEATRDWCRRQFGVDADVGVLFRLASQDPDFAFSEMLALIRIVLETHDGDAIVAVDDQLVMCRARERRFLSRRIVWDAEDLDLMGTGWEIEPSG